MLKLDKNLHKYYYNNMEVPSVSKLLGGIDFSNMPIQRVNMIKEAADRGTRVHSYVESINRDYVRLEPSEDVAPYIDGFMQFVELYDYESIQSEISVVSVNNDFIPEELKHCPFAGTIDDICLFNKERSIIDFKTNSTIQKKHRLQVGAYMLLTGIEKGYILQLKKGGFKLYNVKLKYKDMFINILK